MGQVVALLVAMSLVVVLCVASAGDFQSANPQVYGKVLIGIGTWDFLMRSIVQPALLLLILLKVSARGGEKKPQESGEKVLAADPERRIATWLILICVAVPIAIALLLGGCPAK